MNEWDEYIAELDDTAYVFDAFIFHDFWTQVGVAALCRLNNYISAWYDA